LTSTKGIAAPPSVSARQPPLAQPIQHLAEALQSGRLLSAKVAYVNLSQASARLSISLSPVMQSSLSQIAHSLLYANVPNAAKALAQFQKLMNVPSSAQVQGNFVEASNTVAGSAAALSTTMPTDAASAAVTPNSLINIIT
jgi:hypothetical protein